MKLNQSFLSIMTAMGLSLQLCMFILISSFQVQARAVFAHFMVSNAVGYTADDWKREIQLAQEANIDAFALNIAAAEGSNAFSLAKAFLAADSVGFKLFFSFDYAANGAWAETEVISVIKQYANSAVYWKRDDQPLVSTFEGSTNADDWILIKKETGCFFIPDWSSVDPRKAIELAHGVSDGLFNWAAWPYGPNDMDMDTDDLYIHILDTKPYIMPISPWFFTNMPGYKKNWLWRGDNLWFDRWEQALALHPEFVEIISWNDFGESHYIGPISSSDSVLAHSKFMAFDSGKSPYNYALGMPHDGWRVFLPWLIAKYKEHPSKINQEGVQAWYRLNVAGGCASNGGTTGNTITQSQTEYRPEQIMQNAIFFSALLRSFAQVTVSIGEDDLNVRWSRIPEGEAGIYHGQADFSHQTGPVVVRIIRNNSTIIHLSGADIIAGCASKTNIENWNAWVGSAMA